MNGFLALFRRLEGPQTVGRGPAFWIVFAIVLAIACAYPLISDGYTVGNTVYFFIWVFIALSLCLIWGYGGSLSFGQTAFFGIAGYSYGILTLNFGSAYGFTWMALLLAIAIAALFALVLGYFMFFGRIAGVFLGIVTLAVTLMLERFMAQTAGPEWHIGVARLNGFNGMSAMPPLTIPWPGGDIVLFADIGLYYAVLGLLVVVYLGLRILMNSVVRQCHRRDPGKSGARGNAGLRRAQISAHHLRDWRGAGRSFRRALHGMGAIHHAVEHGHDRGRAAADLGRGRRAKRSHLDVDRNAGGARGLSGPDHLRQPVRAGIHGYAAWC